MPATRVVLEQARRGNQEGGGPFRGIEEPGIGRGELGTVTIGAGRGEQAVDLTPGEIDKARCYDKRPRRVTDRAEPPIGGCTHGEHDRHRVLTPDLVRDPAEGG